MSVVRITKCKGCGNRIDPEWCHCGDATDEHHFGSGHSPVPAGCTCGYAKSVKLVKRNPWSSELRKYMDPARPRYCDAVLAVAALVDKLDHPHEHKLTILRVLVSNLKDACEETACSALDGEI